jgi:dihydropteroate synthase
MGILNITPDSFSDGGRFSALENALLQAERMAAAGAAIIDVGGESTRPGAAEVSEGEELDRIIPVIQALRANLDTAISVDTSKPGVMREAASAGVDLINDVQALRAEGALQAAVNSRLPVCLMHMQGTPRTMQGQPRYEDVTKEVGQFLADRIDACVAAGMDEELIVIDPGFGFGKSQRHNIELLANLRQLTSLGRPLLAGLSRKSTLGELTGKPVDERVAASVAAAVIAVMNGADIVRVHDVEATVDAMRIARAVKESGKGR